MGNTSTRYGPIPTVNIAKQDIKAQYEADPEVAEEIEAIARVLEQRRYFTNHVYAWEAAQIMHGDGIRFVADLAPTVGVPEQPVADLREQLSDLQSQMAELLAAGHAEGRGTVDDTK